MRDGEGGRHGRFTWFQTAEMTNELPVPFAPGSECESFLVRKVGGKENKKKQRAWTELGDAQKLSQPPPQTPRHGFTAHSAGSKTSTRPRTLLRLPPFWEHRSIVIMFGVTLFGSLLSINHEMICFHGEHF